MKNLIYLAFFFIVIGCESKNEREYYEIQGFTQGTTYSIIYYDSLQRDYSFSFDSILKKVDESLSIYNPNSNISKVNRNEITEVDPMLFEIITVSRTIWEQTDGAFDITVGPISNALGFGANKKTEIDTASILKLLPLVGFDKLSLTGTRLSKSNPDMQLDVNAIAQGYTVDLIGRFFESKMIKNFMVDVGGEVVTRGVNNRNVKWVIGVDKPVDNALPGEDIQVKIMISGKGLATSGNYRKFYVENGVKYGHTINPKTGLSAKNSLLSATVIAIDATTADSYATAIMVMGLEKSKEFLFHHKELDAYLIYSGEKGEYLVWMTEGFKELIYK